MGMPFLFRATPQHRTPAAGLIVRKPTRRRQGILGTSASTRTLRTNRNACIQSSIRAICAASSCLAMKESEAETHWLDEHRDPTEAAVVRSVAAQVVAQYGGDLRGMRRALGISNATWVGGGFAVRIANTSVADSMAAEVALVRALPPEVGHPMILGVGTIDGHDWI